MAFDRTNTAHLQALSDEESLDPAATGYAAVAGFTLETLELLNIAANNPTADTGPAALLADDLIAMIFDISVSAQDQFTIQSLLEITESTNSDISRFRTQLSALSTGFAAPIAAHLRPLNRAEIAGQGVYSGLDSNGVEEVINITRSDWSAVIAFRE